MSLTLLPTLGQLPLPDFGADRPLPHTLTELAQTFERAAAMSRRYSQMMAQEGVAWGELEDLRHRDLVLEAAEMIGFEADRFLGAAALIRRVDAFLRNGPALIAAPSPTTGDPT